MYDRKENIYDDISLTESYDQSEQASHDYFYSRRAEHRKKNRQKKIFTLSIIFSLLLCTVCFFAFHKQSNEVIPLSSDITASHVADSESPVPSLAIIAPAISPLQTPASTPVSSSSVQLSTSVPSTNVSGTTEDSDFISENANSFSGTYEPLRYRRSLLSGNDVAHYNKISSAIGSFVDSVEFTDSNPERIMEIAQMVCCDYPEYFWFEGDVTTSYVLRNGIYSGTLYFEYNCSLHEKEALSDNILANTRSIINSLQRQTDYEKVKGIYEYIINNTVYDKSRSAQTCVDVLVNGHGVCAGYANAMNYLLNQLEIDCILVEGFGKSESHAWNIVNVDGNWYHVDCTWGDPVTANSEQILVYDYLLLNDTDIRKDHTISDDIVYPACTSTEYNYYIHEGYFLSSYSLQNLKAVCERCMLSGNGIHFKCADCQVYNDTIYHLFEKEEIWDLLDLLNFQSSHINYSSDDNQLTIELIV